MKKKLHSCGVCGGKCNGCVVLPFEFVFKWLKKWNIARYGWLG